LKKNLKKYFLKKNFEKILKNFFKKNSKNFKKIFFEKKVLKTKIFSEKSSTHFTKIKPTSDHFNLLHPFTIPIYQ